MKSAIKTLFVAALLTVVVSACGGGGGGSAQPTAAVQPASPKPVTVLWAGDSTSVGYELINGTYVRTGIVDQDLQTDLQTQLGNTVTLSNTGIAGSTLEQLLAGTDGFPQPYAQFIAASNGNPVIENFALNEAGESPSQFQQSLITFITLTEQAGKKPILEEPNPACVAGTMNQELIYGNGLTMAAYVAVIDQVAQSYNLPLIKQYEQIKAMPNFCALMSDGIEHPGNALYAIKAQNQTAVLLPIVQSLQKGS
jgi:acyl-CoA thioesterase-1